MEPSLHRNINRSGGTCRRPRDFGCSRARRRLAGIPCHHSVTALGTAILDGIAGGNLVLILLGSYIAGSPAALGVAGSATNTGANPWVNERPRDRR